MKYKAENAVASFFYYMWNAWAEEECKAVFGGMHQHFWNKWSALADKGIFGAAERFFAELSEDNRVLLVERAVTIYDGKALRKRPDHSDILVCSKCGSHQIEIQAWVDANTNEYLTDVDDDRDGKWCTDCISSTHFCSKSAFIQIMQAWWDLCDFRKLELITGIKEQDFTSDEGSQAFVDAANNWWNSQDYECKRIIYQEHHF